MRSSRARVGPKPMIGIFLRRENRPLCAVYGNENGAATVEASLAPPQKLSIKGPLAKELCSWVYSRLSVSVKPPSLDMEG